MVGILQRDQILDKFLVRGSRFDEWLIWPSDVTVEVRTGLELDARVIVGPVESIYRVVQKYVSPSNMQPLRNPGVCTCQ